MHAYSDTGHSQEQVCVSAILRSTWIVLRLKPWFGSPCGILFISCLCDSALQCSADMSLDSLRELPETEVCLKPEIIYFTLGSSVEPVILGCGFLGSLKNHIFLHTSGNTREDCFKGFILVIHAFNPSIRRQRQVAL